MASWSFLARGGG
ncbi:2'-5' RNA ligase, partial [Yersinia pestis PY-02]